MTVRRPIRRGLRHARGEHARCCERAPACYHFLLTPTVNKRPIGFALNGSKPIVALTNGGSFVEQVLASRYTDVPSTRRSAERVADVQIDGHVVLDLLAAADRREVRIAHDRERRRAVPVQVSESL